MNVCLHGKLCKNKKADLSKKKTTYTGNLQTLFVEIPRYKGQWTGLRL